MDEQLTCSTCYKTFVFTESEQQFFIERGLLNKPKRCHNCRLVLRSYRRKAGGQRELNITETSCARCGTTTKVPFQIKGHKPVFCTRCLHTPAEEPLKDCV